MGRHTFADGVPEHHVRVRLFGLAIAKRRLVNEWALTGKPFDTKTALAAGCQRGLARSPKSASHRGRGDRVEL